MITQTRVRNIIKGGLTGLLLTWAMSSTAGTIVGSKHDFSVSGWSGGEICIVCHAPHNTATIQDAPLWNHAVTAATYTTYTSPTFDGAATIGTPDGSSVLCLSCHDGTVAIDSFGAKTGATFITGPSRLGSDLSNDHPISFTYDSALAGVDAGLFDPAVKTVTIGSGAKTKTDTIENAMLFNGKLQCASCHDVHNGFTNDVKLLRITKAGSALCLACHDK